MQIKKTESVNPKAEGVKAGASLAGEYAALATANTAQEVAIDPVTVLTAVSSAAAISGAIVSGKVLADCRRSGRC